MAMRFNDAVVLMGGANHPVVFRPYKRNRYFVGYACVSDVSDWKVKYR